MYYMVTLERLWCGNNSIRPNNLEETLSDLFSSNTAQHRLTADWILGADCRTTEKAGRKEGEEVVALWLVGGPDFS